MAFVSATEKFVWDLTRYGEIPYLVRPAEIELYQAWHRYYNAEPDMSFICWLAGLDYDSYCLIKSIDQAHSLYMLAIIAGEFTPLDYSGVDEQPIRTRPIRVNLNAPKGSPAQLCMLKYAQHCADDKYLYDLRRGRLMGFPRRVKHREPIRSFLKPKTPYIKVRSVKVFAEHPLLRKGVLWGLVYRPIIAHIVYPEHIKNVLGYHCDRTYDNYCAIEAQDEYTAIQAASQATMASYTGILDSLNRGQR